MTHLHITAGKILLVGAGTAAASAVATVVANDHAVALDLIDKGPGYITAIAAILAMIFASRSNSNSAAAKATAIEARDNAATASAKGTSNAEILARIARNSAENTALVKRLGQTVDKVQKQTDGLLNVAVKTAETLGVATGFSAGQQHEQAQQAHREEVEATKPTVAEVVKATVKEIKKQNGG
jgi:hypothetical protein